MGDRVVTDWNSLGDDAFRQLVRREFESYPEHLRAPSRRLFWREQSDWYLHMSAIGWIAPNWPVQYGGMGLHASKLLIFFDEQERHGIARFQDHGIRMIGPALMKYGTAEQKQRLLPPILSCEHRYCQGYSEPDTGSDLASLRTTAVRDGDEWVVNGTKIWTTMAHDVTHIFILARTTTEGKKQQQLGFFLADLSSPGITVRSIRDIAGTDELCEVFLDEVRVPHDNLVGSSTEGWSVAKSVLGFERLHVGSPALPASGLELLSRTMRANDTEADPVLQDRRAEVMLDVEHLAAAYRRFADRMARGEDLGPEVSWLKLWATETFQRIADLIIDVAGDAGAAKGPTVVGNDTLEALGAYYRARPSTIYGGSSEVQRNILAHRVLNLPGI